MADKNYPIPEKPVYSTEIRQLEDTDPASATETFNPLFQKLIDNAHAVKLETDDANTAIQAETKKTDSHIANKSNPHGVTAAQAGAVPTSRTVNSKALTGNITLSAADVSAVPITRKVNGKALSADVTLTAADVGLGNVTNESKATFLGGSPNFSESKATNAAFSENLAVNAPTLGAGWTLTEGTGSTGKYTHASGNTGILSFPIPATANGEFYEITFVQSGTSTTNNFKILFGTAATSTSGYTVKDNIYYSTTFVASVTGAYSWLNIIPDSAWNGTFTLTSIKKATSFNSVSFYAKGFPHIVRGTNMISGGGGKATTGSYNTANGYYALYSNTTGSNNTANGYYALYSNTTGSYNTANGYYALYYNTTGSHNTANGFQALYSNTTGSHNTANGSYALYSNTTYHYNTANGYAALYSNTGSQNTANGSYALNANTTGSNNTANGFQAFYYNTAGSSNTANGYIAGMYLSNGSTKLTVSGASVFIGAHTKGSSTDNQTNQNVFGYAAIGNGSNTITLGNNQITKLYCQVTSITALSDKRIKKDIEPANLEMCKDTLMSLPISRWGWQPFAGEHEDKHVTGFLADDVEKVFPKAVSVQDRYFPVLDENGEQIFEEIEDENGEKRTIEKMFLMEKVKDITMTEATPTLWGAVQWLVKKVEELEGKLNEHNA